MTKDPFAALCRSLLRLYPAAFRRRHGARILEELRRRRREARKMRGGRAGLAAGAASLWDLVRHLPAEHRRRLRHRRRHRAATPHRDWRKEHGSMDSLRQDFRFALRTLARQPGFTVAVIVTLALGIGANTAVFSLLDAVVLRPVRGIAEPEGLVVLADGSRTSFSYPDFEALQASGAFADLAATLRRELHLVSDGESERLSGELVSPGYFALLGVEPQVGRTFAPEEGEVGARPEVVLSHPLWKRRFAGDPGVVGQVLTLNGRPYTVIGVTPASFHGTQLAAPPELWVVVGQIGDFLPGMGERTLTQRGWSVFDVLGRLPAGASTVAVQARVAALAGELEREFPRGRHSGPRDYRLVPLAVAAVPQAERQAVILYARFLLAVVGTVLLIACLNVGNLMAVRSLARQRELALRQALGGGRGRLVRQLVTESALLALAGGAAGVGLARLALPVLARLELPTPLAPELVLDARVFAFACLLTLATGVAFGVLPALGRVRRDLSRALRGRDGGSRGPQGARRLAVAAQMALSALLLVVAGLLLRTLFELRAVDPGFHADRVLTASVDLDLQGYDEARGRSFLAQLDERLAALPGVRSVSLTSDLPLSGEGSAMGLYVEGAGPEPHVDVAQSIVAPGFFPTLGIPLLAGRDFTADDREGAPRVVVVNRALARRFWGDGSALGRSISVSGVDGPFWRVVGVVGDHRHGDLRSDPKAHLFWPHGQLYGMMSGSAATLVMRTESDALALLPAVRHEVRALDPGLPLYAVGTLAGHLAGAVERERQSGWLLTAFALLALVLAAVGVYGVLAYAVDQRRHEIGVRMALGARPAQARALMLRDGARLAIGGLLLGLVAALGATRFLSSFLYGVEPDDPLTLAAVALLLLAVALAASYLPARRAARVDPMRILRHE